MSKYQAIEHFGGCGISSKSIRDKKLLLHQIHLKKWMLWAILSFIVSGAFAQISIDSVAEDVIQTQQIKNSLSLKNKARYSITELKKEEISAIPFERLIFKEKDSVLKSHIISPSVVDKDLFVSFKILSNSDTLERFYFHPGYFYKTIWVFKKQGDGRYERIRFGDQPFREEARSEGYREVLVEPHQLNEYIVYLHCVRTSVNVLEPKLVAAAHVPVMISLARYQGGDLMVVGYVFSGLLLLMVLYSFTNYIQTKSPEFLSYGLYTLFMGMLMFLKTYLFNYATSFNYFFEGYLDFIMQGVGLFFYCLFLNQFLQAKKYYPAMYQVMKWSQVFLGISLLLFSYAHFFMDDFSVEFNIENSVKYVLVGVGLFFIIYGIREDNHLMRFLVWGNILLITFSLFSLLMIVFQWRFPSLPDIFNRSLFYYELGLVLELVAFLAGLSYKNRVELIQRTREKEQLRLENERKELEKQMAVFVAQQEERNRISSDMHDELGSGMTAIRLLSELALNKMKQEPLPEISKISNSANDLLNKMNAIIWSMNSSNDSLENLIAYIRSYTIEFFDNTNITCKVYTPEKIPLIQMSGEKRRNIFLCVKESLNNVVKHAQATHVEVNIQLLEEKLNITITDNGIGIDLQNLRHFGNGLQNMRKRMLLIGASFFIGPITEKSDAALVALSTGTEAIGIHSSSDQDNNELQKNKPKRFQGTQTKLSIILDVNQ